MGISREEIDKGEIAPSDHCHHFMFIIDGEQRCHHLGYPPYSDYGGLSVGFACCFVNRNRDNVSSETACQVVDVDWDGLCPDHDHFYRLENDVMTINYGI